MKNLKKILKSIKRSKIFIFISAFFIIVISTLDLIVPGQSIFEKQKIDKDYWKKITWR